MNSIAKMAQDQIDCIECQQSKERLNADIVKLKNFVNRFKPQASMYMKNGAGYQQWKKDFEEWDNLMML